MKPQVIMHMAISIDGRIVPTPWPEDVAGVVNDIYEELHRALKGDAWIVGRVTMAEFAQGAPRPERAEERLPRTTWKAPGAENGPYAVAIDQGGKLHLNVDRVNGDALVIVLTEAVSDDHLAELRRDGISYLFAGETELNMGRAVEQLAAEFGIKRLLLEGGGGINGSFLEAGVIDEMSVLVVPVADGTDGPTLLTGNGAQPARLTLKSVDRLRGDYLHLTYGVSR